MVNFRALIMACIACLGAVQTVQAQESALSALRQAAKAAPSNAAAQKALALGLIEAGRLGEAATIMNGVVRLGGGSIEALYEARRVDFASDNYRKARAGCRELTVKDEKHVLSNVCMARAFLVWRRASRAFEYIDQALGADPQNYEALLVEGDAKRMQGDYAGARKAYEQALVVNAPGADAHLGLGLVLAMQQQNAQALAELRKAQALAPADPDVQLELGRRLPAKEGLALLKDAVANRPKWPEAEFELASAELALGDAAAAEPRLRALLKATPDNRIATAKHGAALVALGRLEDAEPVLQRALKLIPNDHDTSLALAQLYERTGRHEEAFGQYRNAADLKRESAVALTAAGRLGLELKRPVFAGALLEKALERAPRSAPALALYAEVQAARGDIKGARETLQRALAGEGELDRALVEKRLAELK